MGNRFSSGKNAIAECDRCGQRFRLFELKKQVVKTKIYDLKVCPECYDNPHPQLLLGMYPVDDPQGVRDPRPDRSYQVSGLLADGYLGGGSRIVQWGWNPVGGSQTPLTPNFLALSVELGTLSVVTT